MASTFTTNKSIEKPASGDYNNAWAAPVNADWDDIDTALGGHVVINVNGLSGAVALMLSQYRPPIIEFVGTLSAAVTFVLPAGVGGIWSLANGTSGAFALSFGVSGGGSLQILAGNTSLVSSDGTNIVLADTSAASQAQANAEAFATTAANNAEAAAIAAAETFATAGDTATLTAAETFSKDASNLTNGTVPNAQLPNIGNMPAVVIQADPGGTPTGPAGTMWFYY